MNVQKLVNGLEDLQDILSGVIPANSLPSQKKELLSEALYTADESINNLKSIAWKEEKSLKTLMALFEEKQAEEKPVEEKQAEEKPVEEKQAEEKPVEEKQAEELQELQPYDRKAYPDTIRYRKIAKKGGYFGTHQFDATEKPRLDLSDIPLTDQGCTCKAGGKRGETSPWLGLFQNYDGWCEIDGECVEYNPQYCHSPQPGKYEWDKETGDRCEDGYYYDNWRWAKSPHQEVAKLKYSDWWRQDFQDYWDPSNKKYMKGTRPQLTKRKWPTLTKPWHDLSDWEDDVV